MQNEKRKVQSGLSPDDDERFPPRSQTEGLGMHVQGKLCFAAGGRLFTESAIKCEAASPHRTDSARVIRRKRPLDDVRNLSNPSHETEFPRSLAFPNPQFGNESPTHDILALCPAACPGRRHLGGVSIPLRARPFTCLHLSRTSPPRPLTSLPRHSR
jgi:hypothetical protein